jgi:hypothetical protein
VRRAPNVVLASLLVVTTGCSGLHRHLFGGGGPTGRAGTLSVVPPTGRAGTSFSLTAGGFRAGEKLTFEIDSPDHQRFVGPAHTAGADGTVTSTYAPQATDKPGTYTVKAVGDHGTHASANLVVTGGP